MVKQSDYKETEVRACFSVLLEVMTILGEFRENIVIVGGNVPLILIPSAKERHPGTIDIDLALDFQYIKDDPEFRKAQSRVWVSFFRQRTGKPAMHTLYR